MRLSRHYIQSALLGAIGLSFAAHATRAAASFNKINCVDIADPGGNGEPYFVVSLSRKSTNPSDSNYNTFNVIVKKDLSVNSSPIYETIGTYTAVSTAGHAPYYAQFKSKSGRLFELGLYQTDSLPWADLRMITTTGSHPNETIVRQLECSTEY